MRKNKMGYFIIEIVVFVVLVLGDQLSKHFITAFLSDQPGRSFTLIENVFELHYSENTGASFGLFGDNTLALTIITTIALAAILVYLIVARKERRYIRFPLVLVLAGGIGNLIDRYQFQYVRDFFNFLFMDFAIFNVADMAITGGAILLVIALIVMLIKGDKKPEVVPKTREEILAMRVLVDNAYRLDGHAVEQATEDDFPEEACQRQNTDFDAVHTKIVGTKPPDLNK